MMKPIFVHIPKTAGSSIRTLITANYAPDRLLNLYGNFPEIFSQCRQHIGKTDDFDLIQGHMPYGAHYFLGERVPAYFCFLREPVARTLSDIVFAQRSELHGFHHVFAARDMTLGQCVQEAEKILYYRNNMTQFISGNFYRTDVTSVDYGKAVDNLWNSAFVGITEHFEASLLIMARRLKWRYIVPHVRNVTAKDSYPQPQANDIEACRALLRFDLSLYEVALDIFHQDCKKYGGLLVEAAQQMREILADQIRQYPDLTKEEYLVGMQLETPHHEIAGGTPLARWQADSMADPT